MAKVKEPIIAQAVAGDDIKKPKKDARVYAIKQKEANHFMVAADGVLEPLSPRTSLYATEADAVKDLAALCREPHKFNRDKLEVVELT